MESIRVMNRPEDYAKANINRDHVEVWEEGERNSGNQGCLEWWYFDCDTEDGIKIGVNFSLYQVLTGASGKGYNPFVYFNIQMPDGTVKNHFMMFRDEDTQVSKGKCDVRLGDNHFEGDLETYRVLINGDEGTKIDVTLKSTSSPWRPGIGYVLNEETNQFFTWLCAVPRGDVTGAITVDGKEYEIKGTGYHDHQWPSIQTFFFWNQWVWARQQTDDFTMVLFDCVAPAANDYRRIPIFFIQDKEGRIIFDNTDTETCRVEIPEMLVHEQCGRTYPKVSKYTFIKDDVTVEYTLTAGKEFVYTDHYAMAPDPLKAMFDAKGVDTKYSRYAAIGDFVMKKAGETILEFSGDLLYELESFTKQYHL
ncbi:MAG: hypothetical protein IJH22_01605 [Firmicutes bacterium]|nr:hypothetical protein [Bacillota bacterium]